MSNLLFKYGDWIRWAVVLLTMGAYWVGSSRENYATKDDLTGAATAVTMQVSAQVSGVTAQVSAVTAQVTAVGQELKTLDKSVLVLIEQRKDNLRQDDQIRDFETRIRALERRP